MAIDYCALLETAQKTYDDWIGGRTVTEFRDQNGETIKYSALNADRLLTRIRELDKLCNPGQYKPTRAIGFVF